ncbi:hypothetical protein FNV43_RR08222 [Rhamnella rubrinervis]|uniref:Ubiquitin-like protease family profile domain-containing protein n=1 Tax=Rhamnella rubrinervis TaxID=2594499 RepID=A0A8K0HGT4_9ROSA|nr:hypothetical protein FNV43_RR08222 [Rhamnella rubrinervis]
MATRTIMAPFKRLTKASEKHASSKQFASTSKQIARKTKEKENPKGTKRVAESPSPPPVEKRSRRTVESKPQPRQPPPLHLHRVKPQWVGFQSPANCGNAAEAVSCRSYKRILKAKTAGRTCRFVVKWLIPVDKKYHAHLTSNSNITFALDVIKNKLSKGMDKLKESFVGKFLELKTVQFCGGFIHLLVLNQVECDDTNVIEFDFHGIGARFDRKSFAMITGLNCGKFPDEKELEHLPYDLWVKYFGDTKPMSQSDFIKAFEDLDFDESDEEIWGFETIPIIITFAPRGKYNGVMCPRMLRPSDRKYYGPLVFRADAFQSQPTVLPSLIETITNEGTQTASHPPSDQISDLKLQITELHSDLVAMRTELRSELRHQYNEIQNISSLVRQLVDQFAPKSTQFHVVEYDMMDKSSFNLILTSGGWLRDQEIDATMYYIRKRIINNPQLFDQRCIVIDCMFWASMHGRYVKYLKKSPNEEEDELTKDADWDKEMRDSPFDMYALGMLPVGSKSWLEIDYVYVPVNNESKH